MSTGVTVYKSTDTSAPSLTSTVGSLITVLDAILVNGYGSQPAAGWSKPYTGTNSADYRPAGGNQLYLQINDNGPGAGVGKEARAWGYETMSAYNTGTGLFPTVVQLTNGVFIRKSSEASGGTTAQAWCAVADDRTLYLFTNPNDALGYSMFMFGDFYSFKVGDNYRTMIIGRTSENNATNTAENGDKINTSSIQSIAGHYIARSYTGLGSSVAAGKQGDSALEGGGNYFTGTLTFPNPSDGAFVASPVYVSEGASFTNRRGKMRGLYHAGHSFSNFSNYDTLSAGTKTYIIIGRSYASSAGLFVVETSDTWDTSV